MTKVLVDAYSESHEIRVTFANTGFEDERTLRFVKECDDRWNLGTVWVEAVTFPGERCSSGFKVVDFHTASRDCQPFERVIEKYGIPNKSFPVAERELKLNPMKNYLRAQGWEPLTYITAIGIRADECDRISSTAVENKIWYPLIHMGIKKGDVLKFFSEQPFDLQCKEHEGNCVTCWKKSERKLLTLAVDRPESFEFFARMEKIHSYTGAGTERGPRRFFREKKLVVDIFERAAQPFEKFVDGHQPRQNDELDQGAACGESCEIGADE